MTLMSAYRMKASMRLKDDYLNKAQRQAGPKGAIRSDFEEIFKLQTIQRCFKACGSFSSFFNARNDTRYLKYIKGTATASWRARLREDGRFPLFSAKFRLNTVCWKKIIRQPMRALILVPPGSGERLTPPDAEETRQTGGGFSQLCRCWRFPYYWLDTFGFFKRRHFQHALSYPDTMRHAAMRCGERSKHGSQMHFSHEDAILGSGGGIWNARFHLQWD